ncbi:hypothetical protein [Daejeonella oryzae]|uniref:hypothetical protein n=1 Tax=Daejeonella oryzae TaxID=1122943 RepID=UPI0004033775|nr:hypothetical protein [Daejeonella oryzae]
MLNKDSAWFGSLLGLMLPVAAIYLVEILKKDIQFQDKNHLLYILTVASNLLLVRLYYGKGKEQTARGIIAMTFVCAFAIFIYKSRS